MQGNNERWYDRVPRTTRDWWVVALGVALIFLTVFNLGSVLSAVSGLLGVLAPFILGIVLAYILDIAARFYAEKLFKGRRTFAILLSYLTLVGVVVVLVALVVPQLVQSVSSFASKLPAYTESVYAFLAWVQQQFGLDTTSLTALLEDSGDMLNKLFAGLMGGAGQLAGAAAGVVDGAKTFLVSIGVSIYLIADKESLLRAARMTLRAALPPRAAGSLFSVCAMANKTFKDYLSGQLLDALLVGGETFLLMTLFRLPYAPMISVLVGITNIIPVLGPFIGAIPGAVILLLESPLAAVEFVIIVLVVQQIDGNFVVPRILSGATGLPGLGVLFAITVGGELFGIPGMVLGVPVLAVIVALARQAVYAGLRARGIDEDPDEAAPRKK